MWMQPGSSTLQERQASCMGSHRHTPGLIALKRAQPTHTTRSAKAYSASTHVAASSKTDQPLRPQGTRVVKRAQCQRSSPCSAPKSWTLGARALPNAALPGNTFKPCTKMGPFLHCKTSRKDARTPPKQRSANLWASPETVTVCSVALCSVPGVHAPPCSGWRVASGCSAANTKEHSPSKADPCRKALSLSLQHTCLRKMPALRRD